MELHKSWEFKLIFWFFVGMMAYVGLYLMLVTFVHISTAQMKYSDYAIPFLLGSVTGGIMSAFIAIIAVKKQMSGTTITTDASNLPAPLPTPEPSSANDQMSKNVGGDAN